jgi:peptide methionine sulfoxide reductase MsrB
LCDTSDKFESGRGWAAFDDSEAEAAPARPDPSSPDGRTEIVCANCLRRPGHVFEGGGHTWRNLRRCVNSVSISFVGGATAGDDGLKAGRAEIERLKKGRDDDE